MKANCIIKIVFILFLLTNLISGCAAPVRMPIWPSEKPDGFMGIKWGASPEETKKAIEADRNQWFQDRTGEPPYAIFASATYVGSPALFSYFFTPKTKRLYRVDVTLDDLGLYEKMKDHLIKRHKQPSFSQKDVDHWFWEDKTLVILQRDDQNVQISYAHGPLLEINWNEKEGIK